MNIKARGFFVGLCLSFITIILITLQLQTILISFFFCLPLFQLCHPYFPHFHTFVKMVRVSFAILLTLMAGSALALPQIQEGGEIFSVTTSTDSASPTSGSNPQ